MTDKERFAVIFNGEDDKVEAIYQREALAVITKHVERLMNEKFRGKMEINFDSGGITLVDIHG